MLVVIGVFKLIKAAALVVLGIGLVEQIDLARTIHALTPSRERLLGYGLFVYAGLFVVEGVGLVMRKRWGEWVTTIITGSLVPFEIYELAQGFHVVRLAVLIVNVAIVAYLIARLRAERRAEPGAHPSPG